MVAANRDELEIENVPADQYSKWLQKDVADLEEEGKRKKRVLNLKLSYSIFDFFIINSECLRVFACNRNLRFPN